MHVRVQRRFKKVITGGNIASVQTRSKKERRRRRNAGLLCIVQHAVLTDEVEVSNEVAEADVIVLVNLALHRLKVHGRCDEIRIVRVLPVLR